MNELDGVIYNDDRLFVLSVCRCTVTELGDDTVETVIHHENGPPSHTWCVATFRNTARYPLTRVDHFQTEEEARTYLQSIEPSVPRVSLGGSSPAAPLSYEGFLKWKAENHCQEYDYRRMYLPGGTNPQEVAISRRGGGVRE